MARQTTGSPDHSSTPVPAGSAPADFVESMALFRLHRSSIVAFLQGLPRRVVEQLDLSRPEPDRAPGDDSTDDFTGDVERTLVAMIDRLELLIDRLTACGYPLAVVDDNREELEPTATVPAELQPTWRRLEAAVREATRWAEGIPTGAWDDGNLLAHARAAVGELSWLLR